MDKKILIGIITITSVIIVGSGYVSQYNAGSNAGKVQITDMANRTVMIPTHVNKVVTVGSVPVINSFVEAMGKGNTISNGLPSSFIKQGRWKYQYIFAPQIANETSMQDANNAPNVEEIAKINPDVVFTMDMSTVKQLENTNIPVVYLSWTNPEDVKSLMKLMGQIFNDPARADKYVQYFDTKVNQINNFTIPTNKRPKVLFCSPKTMTVPHKICEWWIQEAGGIPVSANNRTTESYQFDMEQLLKWNPDIIIVTNPNEVTFMYNDTRFAGINAVKNKQIYTTPVGAHVWGHRTIETPLMVEWAATKFYPDNFTNAEMINDTTGFYQQFFGITLTQSQVKEILNGTAHSS